MSLSGLVLGVINIAIVVCILLLAGALVKWGVRWLFDTEVDPMVEKLYIAVVGLIALYMLVALIFGIPSIHIIGPVAHPQPRVMSAAPLCHIVDGVCTR